MRAVFDANVLISAFIFPGGAPEAAYRAAIERRVQLVTSPALLAEFGGSSSSGSAGTGAGPRPPSPR